MVLMSEVTVFVGIFTQFVETFLVLNPSLVSPSLDNRLVDFSILPMK